MYRVDCPLCGDSVPFEVRDGLDDKTMSRALSLTLHGKESICAKCGSIVRLARKKIITESWGVEASYTTPLYDKDGVLRAEAEPVKGQKKDSIFERVKIKNVG